MRNNIINKYFEWLFDIVCGGRYINVSFRKLLMFLHDTEFTFSIAKDENRAYDGIELRRRFGLMNGYSEEQIEGYLFGPCSVLEMMVALAIRCEETIMDDTEYGDRTGQWFWKMISNLELSSMSDDMFDKKYATYVINRFLNREYEPNGKGGLFTINNCDEDLRNVEIWYQLCWYLDSII